MEALSVAWVGSSDGGSLPMSTRSTCSAGGACDTEGWADPDGPVLALGDVHAASTRPRATRAPIDFLNHIDLFLSPYWRTGRGWSEPRYAADRSERPAIGDRHSLAAWRCRSVRPTGFRPPLLLTLANEALAANHVSAAYARTGAKAPLGVAHRAEPANHCPRRKATSRTADPIPLRRFTNTTPRVRRKFIQVDRDRSGNHRERA